jgi:3-oxoacyl-[acyl-carrier protein] reductase
MARLTKLSRSVAGARVVVTGAGSGMGAATAKLFADEGAFVLAADRNDAGVADVVTEISSLYGSDRVVGVSADVSRADDRQMIIDRCVEAFGGVDVLVNNAGISAVSSAFSKEDDFLTAWDATLAINLSAHVHLVRLALPHLLKAPHGGRVINIASTEAIVATPGLAAYTAAKHGVVGLTKSLASELGRHNVTVNAVCPGPIRTAMTAEISDESKEVYARRRVPLRRYGDPEEVAHMTVNLAMPCSSFVNGATVVVDGGMTIKH